MGRGVYETTDPYAPKSSAAGDAIRMHMGQRAIEDAKATEKKEAEDVAKFLRSKQSRGVRAARNAEKEAKAKKPAKKASKKESEKKPDVTVPAEKP